ncbi:MAG: bifunctional ornithine acetyltransferase/N-acetylglutamate synthase [Euryarchaeota archaeon]|nr:bifunctional ornithine acetyltransferase/N-acetylglutamate synthase [Euryarchaeota archaeon]
MKSICAVEGVTAVGIKEGKFGLALIKASGTAAFVGTNNLVCAPPVLLMKEQSESGLIDGIIVNSGCANAYTGEQGFSDAMRMAEIGAPVFNTLPERVGVASTGVIGRYLDLSLIEDQCKRIAGELKSSPEAETAVARAIMTTDLVEKHALVEREGFKIGGIVKGSGMIAPNMGTMIGFIYTDCELTAGELKSALQSAVKRSFNRICVDGDTSTNDCIFLTATGKCGRVDLSEFEEALSEICILLAKQIARDGEGATKLIEMRVSGAPDEDGAEKVAMTVIESPLVKTAVYGEDPNWGRVVAAAGRAGVIFDPSAISLSIGENNMKTLLVDKGRIVAEEKRAKDAMKGATVVFELDLAAGDGEAVAWGCDLTEMYVEINGKYTT